MKVQVELEELNKLIKDAKFRIGAMAMQIAAKDEEINERREVVEKYAKENYDYYNQVEELKATIDELKKEIKFLKSETYAWFSGKQTTITDIEGNKNRFPDHTMD